MKMKERIEVLETEISKLKTENENLRMLLSDRVSEKGMTKSLDIYTKYSHYFRGLKQEHFCIIVLDNDYRPSEFKTITVGTLNQSLVHPREVFATALENRAAAIIICHNHPSGNKEPSQQDIEITKRLKECGDLMGIKVLDHIIFSTDSYFSFVDEELIWVNF